MNRNELIDQCKAIIKEAYEEATEMIVAYLEVHPSEQLATLCKEIDPENWNALRARVQRAQGDRKSVRGADTTRARTQRHAKQALRETPEIVAELTPAEQRALARKLDEESAKRQQAQKELSKQKEREHLGDEAVADLELREELQSTEHLLIQARGNLRGFVKNLGEIQVDNTPEAWRESCLDWLEDLGGHIGMAKTLLDGDNIDWTAFDELLSKEA